MSDINQDDIDKLLQDALVGDDAAVSGSDEEAAREDRGPASQDDIDALFAAVGGDSPPEDAPAAAPESDTGGGADQDDIDALFSAIDEAEGAPVAPKPEVDPDTDTVIEEAPLSHDNDTALFESQLAEAEAAVDREAAAQAEENDSDLNELLSSIAGEEPPAPAPAHDGDKDETVRVDDVDMDELLRQVAEAAPPPPPPARPAPEVPAYGADTAILDMNADAIAQALAEAGTSSPPISAPAAAPQPAPPQTAPIPTLMATPPAPPAQRQEYSVLYGAGEVESVANQINALISSMSEKAHGYMQAWIAADSEAKELRVRALAEERRRSSLEGEKAMLAKELDELRSRLGELEGGKLANEEARRTLETSYQAKIRELDSQVNLLSSEAENLKNELTRTRNESTGIDIESRRARFEVDRLKNEVETERMERLRVQRALENREKEMQALQAQSSGQASSLFIDELHRLVRRLESELDARTSGAHEALKQVDRLEIGEDMVPVVANLRAALMQAIGADDDQDDALKSLGREAGGVMGPAAVAPGKAELVSFETALSTYNLTGAIDIAGALLREAKATSAVLMRKVYLCPALRRPEIAPNLDDLSRLLEGLRTVQEAGDRSRGKETGESEVFYVQMFDFLHNLVRLKLLNRLSGDLWRLFLDLRGRFSFVASDKQWAEYRDQTLNDKNLKA